MSSKNLKRGVIAAIAASLLMAAVSLFNPRPLWSAEAAPILRPVSNTAPSLATPLPDMSTIVERNGPAVVNISMSGKSKSASGMPGIPGLDPDDPFYEFFRHFRIFNLGFFR